MTKKHWIVSTLVSSLLFGGCATTNRTKTLLGMLAGGAVGTTVGFLTTPVGTDPVMHGTYWGLAGAAVMGAAGLFIFDEQKRSSELERQNESLKKELDVYRTDAQVATDGVSLQGTPNFPKEIPDPLRGLVEPGKWTYTRFPANTWKWNGTQSVVRECEKFEFIPPRLKIGVMGNSVGTEGRLTLPPDIHLQMDSGTQLQDPHLADRKAKNEAQSKK
jgi:gas vesicle protein